MRVNLGAKLLVLAGCKRLFWQRRYDQTRQERMQAAIEHCEEQLGDSLALLFGNEHAGVSKESLALCDGNFLIPMQGMVQSLNISVACAVTVFEAMRQRELAGMYKQEPGDAQQELFTEYVKRHEQKFDIKSILPKG